MKKIEISNSEGNIVAVIDGILINTVTSCSINSYESEQPTLSLEFRVPDSCQLELNAGTGKSPWQRLEERRNLINGGTNTDGATVIPCSNKY